MKYPRAIISNKFFIQLVVVVVVAVVVVAAAVEFKGDVYVLVVVDP